MSNDTITNNIIKKEGETSKKTRIWKRVCYSFIAITSAFSLSFAPVRSVFASSAYDNVIKLTSTIELNGHNQTTTWYGDLLNYSSTHPSLTNLSSALTNLSSAISAGSGWAVMQCKGCGGGGWGQIIVAEPNAEYTFFTTAYPDFKKAFGVPADDVIALIAFRYDSSGAVDYADVGATASAGYQYDGTNGYYGFAEDSNTGSPEVLSINNSIDYASASGYAGSIVPSVDPIIGEIQCFSGVRRQ